MPQDAVWRIGSEVAACAATQLGACVAALIEKLPKPVISVRSDHPTLQVFMLHIVRTKPTEQPVEECEFSKMSFELLAAFHAMNSDERTRALQFAKDIIAAKANAA